MVILVPAALVPATGHAQESGIDLEVGLGGGVSPAFFGSDSYILSPVPVIRIKRLTLPSGRTFGGGPETGFSIGPSFDFIGKRSAGDHPELAGLNDIDAAVELGLAAQQALGDDIPLMAISDAQSIAEIAARLVAHIRGESRAHALADLAAQHMRPMPTATDTAGDSTMEAAE